MTAPLRRHSRAHARAAPATTTAAAAAVPAPLCDDSLALLSRLTPRLSAAVQVAPSSHRLPLLRAAAAGRHTLLQVRADMLLLFSRSSAPPAPAPAPLRAASVTLVAPLPHRSAARIVPRAVHARRSRTRATHDSMTVVLPLSDERSAVVRDVRLAFGSAAELAAFMALLPLPGGTEMDARERRERAAATAAAEEPPLMTLGSGATSVVTLHAAPAAAEAGDEGDGDAVAAAKLPAYFAVKHVPKSDSLDSPAALARLLSERQLYAHFPRAPFLQPLLAARDAGAHTQLVTRVAHFGDLRAVQAQLPSRRFPHEVARAIVAQLIVALSQLHDAGWLYRDLKPANVLLDDNGGVQLADFGLAKRVGVCASPPGCGMSAVTASSSESEDGEPDVRPGVDPLLWGSPEDVTTVRPRRATSFVGTRAYMSPEALASPPPPPRSSATRAGALRGYDAGNDVFALGAVLLMLVSGKHVFPHATDEPALRVAAANDAPNLTAVRDDPQLHDLLERMLERDPLERAELADVRRHPWMRAVDWRAVVRAGRRGDGCPLVAAFVRDAGVRGVIDMRREEKAPSGGDDAALLSRVSEDASAARRQRGSIDLNGLRLPQLLGFDYMAPAAAAIAL